MKKKIAFFSLCTLSAALCFYMLRNSVLYKPKHNPVLFITHLRSGMPLKYRDSIRLKEFLLENILKSQKK